MNALQILKNSGNYEEFSLDKLIRSLMKSGLSEDKARQIASLLKAKCDDKTTTKKLYRQALNLIKKESKVLASKYSMSKSITALGPDGYHFEKFVSKVFEGLGYESRTNLFLHGKCIKHEVDVMAKNASETFYCECKFHNNQSTKNDLKTALYVNARYQDIRSNPNNKIDSFWLISNTKFSKDAITYSECAGLTLLGPNYPEANTLTQLATKARVFPIAALTCLKKKHIKLLLEQHCITVNDLYKNNDLYQLLDFKDSEYLKIEKEIESLIKV